MDKFQGRGMKRLAAEGLEDIGSLCCPPPTVNGIAYHGAADMGEMDPHLMGPSGMKLGSHKAGHGPERRPETLFQPVFGDRPLATRTTNAHALAVDGMAADRLVDRAAFGLGRPPDQRPIGSREIVVGEHCRQRPVRGIVFRHHHYTRCVLVETVHDARPAHAANSRQARATVREERIHERAVGVARGRMDDQACRLVEHQEIAVFMEDVEIKRLRLGFGRNRGGDIDDVALARFDLAGRLFYRRATVSQGHAAAFDQRLHAAAREGRQGSRQGAVEPFAGGALVEGHNMAAGGCHLTVHGVFLASPAQAYTPLWLKVLVIVMGLLIVAGFIVVAAEIARRLSSPNAGLPPAASLAAFRQRIALPPGARVVSMQAVGERLVVQVDSPNGAAQAYIVDPRNGALLGTVEFAPAGAGR